MNAWPMRGPTRMGEDQMTWPGAIEHSGLLTTAERLVEELDGLQQRLEHRSEVEYAQHRDFAARARSLADYLRGAILLAQADLCPLISQSQNCFGADTGGSSRVPWAALCAGGRESRRSYVARMGTSAFRRRGIYHCY